MGYAFLDAAQDYMHLEATSLVHMPHFNGVVSLWGNAGMIPVNRVTQ